MPASSAATARDAAVRRLRRLNHTVIAGSAILIGVFSDAAANAVPGHTVKRTAATTTTTKKTKHHRQRKHHTATVAGSGSGSSVSGSPSSSSVDSATTQQQSSTPAPAVDTAPTQQPAPSYTPQPIRSPSSSWRRPRPRRSTTQAPAQTSSGGS